MIKKRKCATKKGKWAVKTKSKFPSYMGRFKTKKEAEARAKQRKKYGYEHKIVKADTVFEGKTYRGYTLKETQRPVRHTYWGESHFAESPSAYVARMKKKGIRAYKK
jgi:hypothetical protein